MVTVRRGGVSPGWVSRGQRFMCYLRNPRNINPFVRLLPGHLQSPKPRNPKKSPKKSPERSLGPPGTPKKVPKKVRKVQKIVDFNYFLDFSDFFGNLLGVPGGPRDLSGDFFGDFLGFRGFGLCRWPGNF